MAKTPPRMDARSLALTVLQQVDKGQAVQAALDAGLVMLRQYFDTQDATTEDALTRRRFLRESALCTELVYGVLRTQIRLRHILGRFLKKPASVPILMRFCLEMTVYSIFFLERVPAHAAVHWAVDFVRARFGARMAALANAVLRNVQREGDAPLTRAYYADALRSVAPAARGSGTETDASAEVAPATLAELSVFYAMPLWIARRWCVAYGVAAAEALMARSFAAPYSCARLCPQHDAFVVLRDALAAAGGLPVCAELASECTQNDATADGGFCAFAFASGTMPAQVAGRPLHAWHDAGALSWQAAGSVAALAAVAPWKAPVWDGCAGQGGKTFALLDAGVPVGLCGDMHSGRLRQLARTARRLGYAPPPAVRATAVCPPLRDWAGDILLDVPCSGLGTLARRPDIRLRRTAADIPPLLHIQQNMLDAAWRILPHGGSVVYMTCTLLPEENEGQVEAFARRTGAEVVCQWQTPHGHPWLEGMFAARLCKR